MNPLYICSILMIVILFDGCNTIHTTNTKTYIDVRLPLDYLQHEVNPNKIMKKYNIGTSIVQSRKLKRL